LIETQPRAARRAVLAIFFVDGAAVATWAANVPLVKERFQLDTGVLGLTLFAIAAGSVIALVLVGGVIVRVGSRVVTSATALALCVTLSLLVLAPSFPALVAALFLFGVTQSALDVAMNSQAVAVEANYRRPIMSSFHALFSLGGLAGAGAASFFLSRGVPGEAEVLGAALVLGALGAISLGALLPAAKDDGSGGPSFALPTDFLLALGVIAFLSLLSEGAMADWSAVYLRTDFGSSAGFAATGYAAFSLAMAAGRFIGDPVRERLDAVPLLRLSGGVSALGLALGLIVGQPLAAVAGFACVGFGLANVVPVLFSAAGRARNVPTGTAIAGVATVGYLGFLAGPPIIGLLAQATTLAVGLGLVVICTALIALLAGNAENDNL